MLRSILKRFQVFASGYSEYITSHPWILYWRNYAITMSSSSSSLSSLPINSSDSLIVQLNEVYSAVEAKLSHDQCSELSKNCRALQERTSKVIGYAGEYDLNGVQANGFWTLTRLVIKFGKVLLNTYKRGKENDHFIPVTQVLLTGLDLCDKFRSDSLDKLADEEDDSIEIKDPNLFATSPSEFIDLLELFKSLEPQLDVVYGTYCAYWLCPSMRRAMQGFTTIMAIYSNSSAKSFPDRFSACKNLWDPKHRAHVVATVAQNATVDFVKSFWGLTELSIVKNALPSLIVRTQPKVAKDVLIPVTSKWMIDAEKADVYRSPENAEDTTISDPNMNTSMFIKSKIRCRLLQDTIPIELNNCLDSLLLHIHGGGFVSQSPDSHEIYLREWACKLKGIPILSVDYSLSPESKYPVALQEILDVYLWLISGDISVEETLGFQPAKIVICGDSAGGNLSMALCLVLKDIKNKLNQDIDKELVASFKYPKAAVCFYTPFILRTIASPSRILTAIDTLLPLGVLLACLDAYATIPKSESSPPKIEIPEEEEKKNSELLSPLRTNRTAMSPVSSHDGVSEAESEQESIQLFDYASLHFKQPLDYDCEKVGSEEESIKENDENQGIEMDDFVHIGYDDIPADEDLLFEMPNDFSFKLQRQFCQTVRNIKSKISNSLYSSEPEPTPWYRDSNRSSLKNKLERLNKVALNPYISPYYGDLDFNNEIDLYLVALNYDGCLDDSIMMGKKFKGSVTLDILDELPHGFLNFVLLSEEGKRGSDLCIKRIKEAFGTNDSQK